MLQCFDPDTAELALNDYKCKCLAPATGEAVASAATCKFSGECDEAKNAKVCTEAGQTCHDPDVSVTGDWICACVAPQSGPPGQQAKATCGTNECVAQCPTCSNGLCTQAEQLCVDPDFTVDLNWLCRCRAPQTGADAVMAAATCAGMVCEDHKTPPVCGMEGCMWVAGVGCMDPRETDAPRVAVADCPKLTTMNDCVGSPFNCSWVTDKCFNDLSTAQPASWNVTCMASTAAQCAKDPRCTWKNNVDGCVSNAETEAPASCPSYTDKPTCTADDTCQWDNAKKECSYKMACQHKAEEACNKDPACEWAADMCRLAATTPTLTLNESALIRGAGLGDGEDDDGCWWCWLLLALLLLCCSFFLVLFLLYRRRKHQTEEDATKWNKQFETQVDDDEGFDETVRTAHKEGLRETERTQSLLYGEEMATAKQEEKGDVLDNL